MKAYPSEPYGRALFCDDLRYEVGGKISLIGVHGPWLILDEAPPAIIDRLVIYFDYVEPVGYAEKEVKLRVMAPAQEAPVEEVLWMNAGPRNVFTAMPGKEPGPHIWFSGHLLLTDQVIREAGRFRFEFQVGSRIIRAGSLAVSFKADDLAQDPAGRGDGTSDHP